MEGVFFKSKTTTSLKSAYFQPGKMILNTNSVNDLHFWCNLPITSHIYKLYIIYKITHHTYYSYYTCVSLYVCIFKYIYKYHITPSLKRCLPTTLPFPPFLHHQTGDQLLPVLCRLPCNCTRFPVPQLAKSETLTFWEISLPKRW